MIGLHRKSIEIVPHRSEWKSLFESEADLLRETIGDRLTSIEHIGSTSVAGLEAKPIIDILAGVRTLTEAEKCVAPLVRIGYQYRGESGIAGRFYFRKGAADVSTHHLNIVKAASHFWRIHLLFRDYLRLNADAAHTYGELKRALAVKYQDNRLAYTAGKTDFINNALEKASAS